MTFFNRLLRILNFNIQVKYKNKSLLMKIISSILFFTNFKTYITTIGNTIYFPSQEYIEKNQLEAMVALGHEYIHIKDQRKQEILFVLKYMFPQILFLMLFPLIFFNVYFLFLFCLLLPLPAYFRRNIELRGYTGTLIGFNEILKFKGIGVFDRKKKLLHISEQINKEFVGFGYYLMWPFGVKKQLHEIIEKILISDMKQIPIDDIFFDRAFLTIQESIKESLTDYRNM